MAVWYLKSTFKICVDRIDGHEISGRLINPFTKQQPNFSNIYELIEKIERMLNTLGFPQCTQTYRSFRKINTSQGEDQTKEKGDLEKVMDDAVFEREKGSKATFIVQVQFRQNATWQGTISWVEEKQEQKFRSALEMIKLMDSAVNEYGFSEEE